MAGKQAKVLGPRCVERLLRHVGKNRYPTRDRAIVLLSVKAGLRAGEIANLTWSMILNSEGKVGRVIELHDLAAKKGSGRSIPIHPDLKKTLAKLLTKAGPDGPAIRSESGGPMKPNSIINWFGKHYRQVGLAGCSSHSGRRTFITNAARKVHLAGGSLRDVQQLAGHRSIDMTQRYIEGDTDAKRRLVAMI
ncbi:MAG: site-specific integrase [Rhodospirillaceae bacterium]|jgi:integrase|nr:site-specific integrase [Rhodospirillaceae bacterium]